jgi:hypothetical protein
MSDELGQFTSVHTRVAWVQDQGKGADTFALGQDLRLMGYDSKDGKKERFLLKETGNFYKPLFTPDGKQVVVSNRRQHKIYLVDFTSQTKTELGQGVAVEVWGDPATGRTWVYALSGDGPENVYFTTHPLVRFPLEAPQQRELVWDKTHLSWSNFDLSRDGRFAGGLFPWPHAGILIFDENKWKQYGKGCWTALSPDNSALLWVFDGLHRNLNFVNPFTAQFWSTNINNAPGINGYEVYHPRWSNHVYFLTMTGPYMEGEGGNKITGGGQKVEVYIGRFSSDLKKVEQWFQLTHNDRADFYPDVWLASGGTSTFSKKSQTTLPLAATTSELTWPTASQNLIFLWQHVLADNKLDEKSRVGFSQFRVSARGSARFNRFLEMDLQGSGFNAELAGKKSASLINVEQAAGLELLYTPSVTGVQEQGVILAVKEKGGEREVSLLQQGKQLVLALRTPGEPVVQKVINAKLLPHQPVHIFVQIEKNRIVPFINGRRAETFAIPSSFLGDWPDITLVLGKSAEQETGLRGAISHVALYAGTVEESVVVRNAQVITGELESRKPVASFSFNGELIEVSRVPRPDELGAYQRALVVNRYKQPGDGTGKQKVREILVAQWAILDRTVLPEAKRFAPGYSTELTVEKFDDHPELEGERLIMDMFDPDLEIYYQVSE